MNKEDREEDKTNVINNLTSSYIYIHLVMIQFITSDFDFSLAVFICIRVQVSDCDRFIRDNRLVQVIS